MIFGRPTNLWLGLLTAIQGAISVTAVVFGADPTVVATISGAWAGVFGAIILVIANQPPTLNPGDSYVVQTAKGEANITGVVAPTPTVTNTPPSVTVSTPAQDVTLDG